MPTRPAVQRTPAVVGSQGMMLRFPSHILLWIFEHFTFRDIIILVHYVAIQS
jgi:hypothetical protein